MTNKELSQFIKHYIEKDKTRSAIMLTAPWGTGKSYYIQNELIPFLKEDETGNHACIVVSLYGVNSFFEISKAIYIEARMKVLKPDSEKTATGKFATKTVIKGVTSFFGIDLSKTQEEMQELYESIDLSGKLIILEDLERSGIEINAILGYVNNLVEQDGVKVLLVANEDELIRYEPIKEETQEKQEKAELIDRVLEHKGRTYTELTKKYLATKEKTVSDTILFEGDFLSAIKHIMSEFKKAYFESFSDDSSVAEIHSLLCNNDITNLRTFIFACQKTNDIFERIKPDPAKDSDFIKTIFYSIILFSQKIKTGTRVKWDGGQVLSVNLSSEKYPLFRFCYDYIIWQSFDIKIIDDAKEALNKLRLYDEEKSNGDCDLKKLYYWYLSSEEEVKEAVKNITSRLHDDTDISFYEYGRIAIYMVVVKSIIGCDIKEAKKLLIKNLYNKGDKIDPEYLFTISYNEDENPEIVSEFELLKAEMIKSLSAKDTTIFDFDYQPSSLYEFSENARRHYDQIIRGGAFLARLDPDRILGMLKKCTAENIYDFRRSISSVYHTVNIRDYLEGDKENVDALLSRIKGLELFEEYDKIQKKQIQWLIETLEKISKKL